jgi:hypothetical protein
MNDRWDNPFKISQNSPGTPMGAPTQTVKKNFFKNLLLQNQNWYGEKNMVL